jgi:hypothetical protein
MQEYEGKRAVQAMLPIAGKENSMGESHQSTFQAAMALAALTGAPTSHTHHMPIETMVPAAGGYYVFVPKAAEHM